MFITSDFVFLLQWPTGSSGSRINIYSWPARTKTSVPSATEAPEVKSAGFPTKINPGISAVKVASEAGATLAPLLNYAKFVVPKDQHAETPIYFMCTAGMRLLAETDPEHTVAILDSVRRYLSASGFKFDNKWALILPGQSEGVFAWISTNYLLRSLSTESKTAAALDMGGASQVLNARLIYMRSF
jgi:Golgi nucleoside diphosphatase